MSSTMALIEVLTYVCGVLGGVLLLLCIVLAVVFLFGQGRKREKRGSS